MKKRRTFPAEFKARVALEALSGAYTLAELAAKHDLHPNMIAPNGNARCRRICLPSSPRKASSLQMVVKPKSRICRPRSAS